MKTVEHGIPESVKEILHDPSFVLWRYAATEESEQWWADWIERHPERKADVLAACAILQATKMNDFRPSDEDSDRLFARILTSVEERESTRQRRFWWPRVAAACLVLAVTAGSWLYIQRDNRPAGELVVADFATIDTTLTEVELELTGHQKVQVVNKAVIELNDTGAIHVNREEIRPETGNRSEEARGPAMNVLKVPRGRHSSLVLADGTKVWINSGSVLYFPTVFDPDHRTIYAGGEIYLEVAKDASRPFYVKTSEMTVRALGTALNVTAYPDDADQSVVLSEGRVEVAAKNGRKQLMAVNDRLVLKDRRMTVSTVQAYDYTSWKDGIFLFRDQSLAFVAQRLSRYYQMNFTCMPGVADYSCSGKLALFEDLNKVLRTLEEGLPVLCTVDGNTVTLSIHSKKRLPMK